jgi:hypothetical protein
MEGGASSASDREEAGRRPGTRVAAGRRGRGAASGRGFPADAGNGRGANARSGAGKGGRGVAPLLGFPGVARVGATLLRSRPPADHDGFPRIAAILRLHAQARHNMPTRFPAPQARSRSCRWRRSPTRSAAQGAGRRSRAGRSAASSRSPATASRGWWPVGPTASPPRPSRACRAAVTWTAAWPVPCCGAMRTPGGWRAPGCPTRSPSCWRPPTEVRCPGSGARWACRGSACRPGRLRRAGRPRRCAAWRTRTARRAWRARARWRASRSWRRRPAPRSWPSSRRCRGSSRLARGRRAWGWACPSTSARCSWR